MPSECITSSRRGGHVVVERLHLPDLDADGAVLAGQAAAAARRRPARPRCCRRRRTARAGRPIDARHRQRRAAVPVSARCARSIRTAPASSNGVASNDGAGRVGRSAASGPWPRPSATMHRAVARRARRSRQVSPQTVSRGAGRRDGAAPRSAPARGRGAAGRRTRDTTTVPLPGGRVDVEVVATAAAPRPARCPACRRSSSRPAGSAARRPCRGPRRPTAISSVGVRRAIERLDQQAPVARVARRGWSPARWRRCATSPRRLLVEADRLRQPRRRRGAPRRPGSAPTTGDRDLRRAASLPPRDRHARALARRRSRSRTR